MAAIISRTSFLVMSNVKVKSAPNADSRLYKGSKTLHVVLLWLRACITFLFLSLLK